MIRENIYILRKQGNIEFKIVGIYLQLFREFVQGRGYFGKVQKSGQKWSGGYRSLCEGFKKEIVFIFNGCRYKYLDQVYLDNLVQELNFYYRL